MGRKYISVEFCVKIFTYLILCEKLFRKSHVSQKWPKIAEKSPKKARIFVGHSVQDCSKRTLVYMGIFFTEPVKKSRALKSFP